MIRGINITIIMKLIVTFVIMIGFGAKSHVCGQSSSERVSISMPQIALVDIEPDNSTIVLNLKPAQEAGLFEFETLGNNVKWINYSSAIEVGTRRGIFVQLTSGSVPSGTSLFITAGNSAGGAGVLGSSVGAVQLSNSPSLLIQNIGGAFTGNGANRGHSISYKLEVTDVAKLNYEESQTVTVSFTILDI